MQVKQSLVERVAELAEEGVSVAAIVEKTGHGENAVAGALVRWLRCSGRVDVTPWVDAQLRARVEAARTREPQPTMTQLATELQIPLWTIQVLQANLNLASAPPG